MTSTLFDAKVEAERCVGEFAGAEILARLRSERLSTEDYAAYLGMMFHFVRSSSETLVHAGAAVQRPELREYLWEHAVEERGHERLLLRDLTALGQDPAASESAAPLPLCQAYVSYFRTAGTFAHPAERLGAVFAIENIGKRLGTSAYKGLARLGIADAACSFLRSHGTLDQEHADHVTSVLAAEAQDPDIAAAVVRGARIATRLYRGMHDACLAPPDMLSRPVPFAAAGDALPAEALRDRLEAVFGRLSEEMVGRAPMMRALSSASLSRDTYAAFLVQSYQWLDHSPITLCLMATAPALRWAALRDYLWVHSREKAYRHLIADDLAAIGMDPGALAKEPPFWTRLFIAYLYDTSRVAPLQRLGLMLFIERLQAMMPVQLPEAIGALLGLGEGSGTRYLSRVLGLHAEHGSEVTALVASLTDLTAAEQNDLVYGCAVGGYLYARMLEGSDDVLW